MSRCCRSIPILLTIVFMLSFFIACGASLSGTYKPSRSGEDTYSFSRSNKVTVTSFGIHFKGTYKINGDEITFSIDDWGSVTYSYERNGNKLIIDGIEYSKG